MNNFLHRIEASGFLSFYRAFGPGNTRSEDWYLGAKKTSGSLRSLIDFLLLGRDVPLGFLQEELGSDFLHELTSRNMVTADSEKCALNSYRLISFEGFAYFAQFGATPDAYFGTDSLALAAHQVRYRRQANLDICMGPGIQTLVAAASSDVCHGVEINSQAARVAELNFKINGIDRKTEIFNTSVDRFLTSPPCKYDTIVFNPPLVPIPPGYHFPVPGGGGVDGLEIAKQVLPASESLLSAGGSIRFIGMACIGRGDLDYREVLGRLAQFAGLRIEVLLTSAYPLAEQHSGYDNYVRTLWLHNREDLDVLSARVRSYYQEHHISHFGLFVATATRAGAGDVSVLDLSYSGGGWFA